jgi:hypothetical protein
MEILLSTSQRSQEVRKIQSILCKQFGKANSIPRSVTPPNVILQKILLLHKQSLPGVAIRKKPQWKYWTQWTFSPLKNAKIQTKTHEMDVLEAVENEALESHSRGPGSESLCAHNNEPDGSFFYFNLLSYGLPQRV